MKVDLGKLLLVVALFILAAIIVLPIGVNIGREIVGTEPTPEEYRGDYLMPDGDANQTEVTCKYWVGFGMEDMTIWTYSDAPNPEPADCDLLTTYWHDEWLFAREDAPF